MLYFEQDLIEFGVLGPDEILLLGRVKECFMVLGGLLSEAGKGKALC